MPSIPRFLAVAAVVVLVLLWGGCQKTNSIELANQSDHDDALRAYQGIQTLRGSFRLPASTKGYYPVALIFENGEEVGRSAGVMLGLGNHSNDVPGEVQLLISTKDRRAFFFHGGNSTELGDKINWAHFGGSTGWAAIPANQEIRYKDVSVRAVFATAPRPEISPSIRQDDQFPKSGGYVIAIGVASGDDMETLRKRFEAEPAYQAPKGSKPEGKL